DADAQRHVERTAGKLLGDGGAALGEVQFEIEAFRRKEALVHGHVNGPQRRLAAERARHHLVGSNGWTRPRGAQRQQASEQRRARGKRRAPHAQVPVLGSWYRSPTMPVTPGLDADRW